jgi:hypothetical protein
MHKCFAGTIPSIITVTHLLFDACCQPLPQAIPSWASYGYMHCLAARMRGWESHPLAVCGAVCSLPVAEPLVVSPPITMMRPPGSASAAKSPRALVIGARAVLTQHQEQQQQTQGQPNAQKSLPKTHGVVVYRQTLYTLSAPTTGLHSQHSEVSRQPLATKNRNVHLPCHLGLRLEYSPTVCTCTYQDRLRVVPAVLRCIISEYRASTAALH